MDYEKAYKHALEIARKINSGEGVPAPPDWTVYEVIFPELKESDDERIRKNLIRYLYALGAADNKEFIDWLEKQKPVTYDELPQCPHKYNQGDWIVSKLGEIYQIKEVLKGSYNLLCKSGAEEINSISIVDNTSRLLIMHDIVEKQKPAEWSDEDEQYLLVCKNALRKYQVSDKWDADIISKWLEGKLKQRMEGWELGYKDAIDKACEWLSEQMFELNACEEIYVADGYASSLEEFLNNFKKAMEE